jgi:hypothetical protein
MARTFYRIVSANPPVRADFTSNEAKGRPLTSPTPERRELWRGLSAYSSLERARAIAAKYPVHGRFVAKLVLEDDSAITVMKTLGAEHYTLWGEPEWFLKAVVSITSIEW